jgi:hypothetical protein
MDNHQFASELWQSLTDIALFNQVAMHREIIMTLEIVLTNHRQSKIQ